MDQPQHQSAVLIQVVQNYPHVLNVSYKHHTHFSRTGVSLNVNVSLYDVSKPSNEQNRRIPKVSPNSQHKKLEHPTRHARISPNVQHIHQQQQKTSRKKHAEDKGRTRTNTQTAAGPKNRNVCTSIVKKRHMASRYWEKESVHKYGNNACHAPEGEKEDRVVVI